MDIHGVLSIALPVVFVIVGISLIFLVVELIKTVRQARTTITDVQGQLEPTLKNVQEISAAVEPVVQKADPLVDRVSLTVDALNLELMRLDQILEDVSEITDTASSTVDAIDSVANAPLEMVSSMSSRVRDKFKSKNASDETKKLVEQRAAVARALEDLKNEEKKPAEQSSDYVTVGAKDQDTEVQSAQDEPSAEGLAEEKEIKPED